jgi:hypothetical protein
MAYIQRPTFSINSYDKDGDIIDVGVFLHYDDVTIYIADTLNSFKEHIKHLENIAKEISENYKEFA